MKTYFFRILMALTILVISLSTYAQDVRFGVFADPQISWFTSDTRDYKQDGLVFGFNAGLFFDRYFAERYAITSGVSISNLGGYLKYNIDSTLTTRDEEYNIPNGTSIRIRGQYINVPLGFKFKTTQIGYTTIYAQVGIDGHIKLKAYAWEEDLDIDKEVLENNQMYFGFVSYMFGGGIEYSLGGPSALQIGVTFSNGITPVLKSDKGIISIGNLGLRLGVIF